MSVEKEQDQAQETAGDMQRAFVQWYRAERRFGGEDL